MAPVYSYAMHYICSKENFVKYLYFLGIGLSFTLLSCKNIVVNERVVNIPKHTWQKDFEATVKVEAPDSGAYYPVFIIRYSEKYSFENILVHLVAQDSTKKDLAKWDLNIPLANKNGSWKGKNMDDLYDYRVKVIPSVVLKAGTSRFIVTHQMKQNSFLENILNVGIALEKAN